MSETPPINIAKAEAQTILACIVESSDDAIISKNLDGIISSWNRGAERMFGYSSAEMVGRPLNVIIPDDRQGEEVEILRRIRAGDRVNHFETVRQRKDGQLVDVSVMISPLRDATGTIVGASKIARDITDQKRVLRELNDAKDAAVAANQAKDQFLSVLSHELRTPLTPVLAAVSLIENDPMLSSAELRSQIEMIRRNVETEARIVDDLLDVTRIARGAIKLAPEVVDVHGAVRNVIAMVQGAIDEKRLTVTLALRARRPHVWADPGRLQQVLLNLLSNAVKFTPVEGSVVVMTSDGERGRLRIEVSDTGIGIQHDLLPRLFNAFEQGERTVTRRFGGMGLGLSIVKSLVEMHGGTIAVASAGKDRGTTVTVELPSVPATTRGPRPHPSTLDAKSGHRVLLVEDHMDTRLVLDRLLSSLGFTVRSVGSVREAIDLSDRESFDLLVSDIGLPDGTGHQVMTHLRERYGIRGIALSGFGQDDDLRRSEEAGFEQHLTKPVSFQTLKDVILKIGE